MPGACALEIGDRNAALPVPGSGLGLAVRFYISPIKKRNLSAIFTGSCAAHAGPNEHGQFRATRGTATRAGMTRRVRPLRADCRSPGTLRGMPTAKAACRPATAAGAMQGDDEDLDP
jgi:hypothetical protein